MYTGENTEKRGAVVKNLLDYDFIMISKQAGGTGLNLQEACVSVILEPHFNPQMDRQAVGRIARPG